MTTIKTTKYGLVVVSKADWPSVGVGYEAKDVLMSPSLALHTTQLLVDSDVVESKIEDIKNGVIIRPSIFKHDGVYWIYDGHHAFAAYKTIDPTSRIPASVHRVSMFGSINPPVFRRRK